MRNVLLFGLLLGSLTGCSLAPPETAAAPPASATRVGILPQAPAPASRPAHVVTVQVARHEPAVAVSAPLAAVPAPVAPPAVHASPTSPGPRHVPKLDEPPAYPQRVKRPSPSSPNTFPFQGQIDWGGWNPAVASLPGIPGIGGPPGATFPETPPAAGSPGTPTASAPGLPEAPSYPTRSPRSRVRYQPGFAFPSAARTPRIAFFPPGGSPRRVSARTACSVRVLVPDSRGVHEGGLPPFAVPTGVDPRFAYPDPMAIPRPRPNSGSFPQARLHRVRRPSYPAYWRPDSDPTSVLAATRRPIRWWQDGGEGMPPVTGVGDRNTVDPGMRPDRPAPSQAPGEF